MRISLVIVQLRIYDRLTFSVSLSYFLCVHSVENSSAKSWCRCSRLACGSQSANVKISIVVCAAPVPRLTLPSPTIGTGVMQIWCADLLVTMRHWPCGFSFLYHMSVLVLSCNIIMSLSVLMYFFTVFEAAPLYSFI